MGCGDVVCPPGVVRIEAFCKDLDTCFYGGGQAHHHFVGASFELEEKAGQFGEMTLATIVCTAISVAVGAFSGPGGVAAGFVCSLAAGTILIYWEHEKIYTVGVYDYDIGPLLRHRRGVALGWHNTNVIPVGNDLPLHLVTW